MSDLLFYALLMALLYYFFIYLPNKKKLSTNNRPLVSEKGTQTETKETIIIENEPGPEYVKDNKEIEK